MNHDVIAMHHATPGSQMPWPVTAPFRVAPGLHRVADASAPLFLRDALAERYAQAKQQRLALPSSQVGRPNGQVLRDIADRYQAQTGVQLVPQADALSQAMQEDFVILFDHGQARGFETEFLSVCFPSNWSPPEKLGKDFLAIHAPVADNGLLLNARAGIESIAFRQQSMVRHVWLLTPTGELAQDPGVRQKNWASVLAESGNDPHRLLSRIFFRVERQSTLPLPHRQRAVFFIRILVSPLHDVLALDPARAATLAASLSSMSAAFLAYRGMQALREPLCKALARFADSPR